MLRFRQKQNQERGQQIRVCHLKKGSLINQFENLFLHDVKIFEVDQDFMKVNPTDSHARRNYGETY